MKKLESSLTNMLLVLTVVTVVAVGLLAYVNELTKGPIAEANMKALDAALKSVVPEYTNNPVLESDTIFEEKDGKKYVKFILYPAKKDDKLIGTAVEASSLGFSGEIKILVGFDSEGKIYDYSLLSHSETPGLGSKADLWFKEGNRGNIVGMSPGDKPLAVTKDQNGQIDAITASTITSRAFLNAVNAAYAAYKGNPDAVTSASQKATEADGQTAATRQETDVQTAATVKVEQADSVSNK